jgi:hypothetical protein
MLASVVFTYIHKSSLSSLLKEELPAIRFGGILQYSISL